MEKVYLLYEGDEYLSSKSLVLMGIFSDGEMLRYNAEKLIRERANEHLANASSQGFDFEDVTSKEEQIDILVDDILTELLNRGATCGWDTNYCYTTATINELGEI